MARIKTPTDNEIHGLKAQPMTMTNIPLVKKNFCLYFDTVLRLFMKSPKPRIKRDKIVESLVKKLTKFKITKLDVRKLIELSFDFVP